MKVAFSSKIRGDLKEIGDYIAEDNPTRAITFVEDLRKEMKRIGQNPYLYQLRPEAGAGHRQSTVGRYVILFQIRDDLVIIQRVIHGNRLLPPLFM